MSYSLVETDDPRRMDVLQAGRIVGAVHKVDGGWFGHARTPTAIKRSGPWFYPESALAAIEMGVCKEEPLTSRPAAPPSA